MKILGIDYGKSKMGTALSEGLLATPLKTIPLSGLDDAVRKTEELITREDIEKIIIGMPESGEALKITQSFVKVLRSKVTIEIEEVDETLSSVNARLELIELGLKDKKRKEREDAHAAALILQKYLDNHV